MKSGRSSAAISEKKTSFDKSTPAFRGLPEAGFRFLRQLKANNNREWFREHKAEYDEHVHEPMTALVRAVEEQCRAFGMELYAKEKNPVMRVYRDVRFSNDKTPYKTHVAAELRRSFSNSEVMLYLHFSPKESFVAAGLYQPDRAFLQSWREFLTTKPEKFEKMISQLNAKGLELNLEYSLSNMPRGYQQFASLPVGKWLKLTSFVTSQPFEAAECGRPELALSVAQFALDVKPLLEFGWSLESNRKVSSLPGL